jgi:hypothetical protein
VIPVEYAACGAAAGMHEQPEGAPDEHTNQIADIENDRNKKQGQIAQDSFEMKDAYNGYQREPQQHYFICGMGGAHGVFLQRFIVDLFPYGFEII